MALGGKEAHAAIFKKAKELLGKVNPDKRKEFVQQLAHKMHESPDPEAPLLVFCDEAHLHLDTDLGWGWAPRGQRCMSTLTHRR